jgi:hypothetical protein
MHDGKRDDRPMSVRLAQGEIMTSSILGSRSCRGAVLGLLCAGVLTSTTSNIFAQEMIVSDEWDGNEAVVSDSAIGPTPSIGPLPSSGSMLNDGGTPHDSGYRHGGYGNCDGYMPCDDCPPCEPGHPGFAFTGWFGAEYIKWRLDGNRLPPLVTAGPSSVPLADVARLDEPSTIILSGDETIHDDWRDGYRVFGGFWFDCCHTCGIGVDYFDLGDDEYNYFSPQDPAFVTGRPFYNSETGEDDLEFVSVPDELDGTAEVRANDDFKGGGLTINRTLWRHCDPCRSGHTAGLTLLSGYRYYKYDSNLSITEQLIVLPGTTSPLVPGTFFYVDDRFRTCNEFNGGEIGLQAYKTHCWWWVDGMAKFAIGSNRRTVTIDGFTFVDVPGGGTAQAQGGLLTSEVTNIGRHSDTDFAVIPEFRLGIGVSATDQAEFQLTHCSLT